MAGEKRSQDQEESLLKENVIVVDIEGTTTSITFVKEKLFPYVRENVKNYLNAKWDDEEFKRDLEKLKEQAKKDEEDKAEGLVPISGSTVDEEKESVLKNILWQMDGDRKTGALKQLQGHMWREAYDSGKIKGHVYEDVPECLKSWKSAGKKVYVYSSGSVEAQKLLFGHSEHGDLLEYFSGYFDTEIGMKQEAASYKNILSHIKSEGSDVIFLTDVVKEAKAAKEAGLSTIIMIREGNAPLSDEDKAEFKTVKSFLDLSFVNAAKRPKLETAEGPKEEVKAEVGTVEKMEVVTEDVEMTDVSDNKDSKSKVDSVNESKVESETNEIKNDKETRVECAKSESNVDKDEAMETDGKPEGVKKIDETIASVKSSEENKETAKAEVIKSEKESEKASKVEDDVKSNEVVKPDDKESKAEVSAEKTVSADETDKAVIEESKKMEITDKKQEISDEKTDPAKTQTDSASDVAMEESVAPETADAKLTKVIDNATETKTEGSEESSELKKDKLGNTETEKAAEGEPTPTPDANVSCTKPESAVSPKPEELEKKKENVVGVTDSEKKVSATNETLLKSEESVQKSKEVSVEETVKENGTATAASSSASASASAVASKVDIPSKTESETAVASDKKEIETEMKKTEKKNEESVVVTESKDIESKSKEEKTNTATESNVATDANNETETKDLGVNKSGEDKQSGKDIPAKTDVKESSKDGTTNAAIEPVKKINGTTTQNGADSSPADNDNQKIHTNGVNEACTSDAADAKTNKEASSSSSSSISSSSTTSPQKREPESSIDASAESIKVKKVVDSTVADGAGEPDVVPPAVVVAATS